MPSIYQTAQRFRQQLLAEDDAARESLFAAYRAAIKALDDDLSDVTSLIANARRAGETVGPSWLFRQARFQSLLLQVAQEIRRIADQAAGTLPATQAELVRLAQDHMRDLSRAQVTIPTPGIGIAAQFNRLNPEAVTALVGFLSDGSPLLDSLDTLAPAAVQGVRDALTLGVIRGDGVPQIARRVRDAIGGNGVTALRIAHNATLNAYREAGHLSMLQNRDILAGWYWLAALGASTPPCASCVALHGTFHRLTERLRDHLMGRCVAAPGVKGEAPLDFGSGEDWLEEQDDATQREVFRAGNAWRAWTAGRLPLSAFTTVRRDPRWGHVHEQPSLKELLGAEEARQWRAA